MEQIGVLSEAYTKLTVVDIRTGEEIAVVTNEMITTASENIVIKLTPRYN